jgi:hypothetical protein
MFPGAIKQHIFAAPDVDRTPRGFLATNDPNPGIVDPVEPVITVCRAKTPVVRQNLRQGALCKTIVTMVS